MEQEDVSKEALQAEKAAENNDTTTASKKGLGFGHWVKTAILCLICSVVAIIAYDRFYVGHTPKIVAVDLKGFIQKEQALFMQGKLTKDQLEANVKGLTDKIMTVPADTAVITNDVVVRNVERLDPDQ